MNFDWQCVVLCLLDGFWCAMFGWFGRGAYERYLVRQDEKMKVKL
jgi:hypothetical protein